jgi:hypothetical protein
MTSTTRLAPQLRLLRQIGSANDNFNKSSQLETSRERASNYSATNSAQSTTSRNQLRLVGFIDKPPTAQSYALLPTFCATHTLFIDNSKPPNHVQIGLRRFNPGSSLHWKRIWIIYQHSKKEPPRFGGLLFSITTRIQLLMLPRV